MGVVENPTLNAPVGLLLHPDDNVVVLTKAVSAGQEVMSGVRAIERVAFGHKLALCRFEPGDAVIKYGQVIGEALEAIEPGAHVHDHNIAVTSKRVGYATLEPVSAESAAIEPRFFDGYRRASGKAGTRNYIGVLTTVNCAATVAHMIADRIAQSDEFRAIDGVDGVVPITHGGGCGMAASGEGFDVLSRTLWGTALNPNFAGVMVVGLGCEIMQIARLSKLSGQTPEHFHAYTIQQEGGTRKAVERGIAQLLEIAREAGKAKRETIPASELVLGLQCGGSDAWSGLTANPSLGAAADRIAAHGGTVLLSETPEIYGAEHLLMSRARSADVAEKLQARLAWWEDYTRRNGAEMNNNPSPGNKLGGLSTILEKSLGAVAKGGTSSLNDVIEYGEPVGERGLVFMDSPGYDPCSVTGQVASGANMVAFTTGRGSAFGSRPTPCLKLASNSNLYERMQEDMDVDCGPVLTGERTVDEMGQAIFDEILASASGRATKSEALGYGGQEFVPWQIGAVM